MWSAVWSGSLQGLAASLVRVEVDLQAGLPSFGIVGLPDAAVRESRERVRSALKNEGFAFPMKRITVNLAPAHLKKEGSSFELAIALVLLMADQKWEPHLAKDILFLGELSLKGELNPVRGILPLVLDARKRGFTSVLVPAENAREAAMVHGIDVYGIGNLKEAVRFLKKEIKIAPARFQRADKSDPSSGNAFGDYSDVVGQRWAKKALEIAAAGGHHLLMMGSPGCGKSMLARRLPTIFPPLSFEESLEVSGIYSVMGLLKGAQPPRLPPFRSPHHTISYSAMVGGGTSRLMPGEISLAHRGILFLDELAEFHRDVLEVLREPMEEGKISICRTGGRFVYPADFMLVAAMNPCPCGNHGDPERECLCGECSVRRYQRRISGPLLDRIDIHLFVSRISLKDLSEEKEEASGEILSRVSAARKIQRCRFKKMPFRTNAQMTPAALNLFCFLPTEARKLLHEAMEKLGFSLRAYHRILKISRTLADLEGEAHIRSSDIAQALQLRFLDKQGVKNTV